MKSRSSGRSGGRKGDFNARDGARSAEWREHDAHRGFDVDYRSPAEGHLHLDSDGSLTVDGRHQETDGYPRFDNRFASVAERQPIVTIGDEVDTFHLDLAAGTRTWEQAIDAPAANT